MAARWDVLGIGCNSVDYVYRVPASPRADSANAKLRISSHDAMCGGQMATAMAACAALGLRAAYLGCVGNDQNGKVVVSELGFRGVDVSPVMTRDCPNRFAVITVDESTGDRIVLWDRDDRLNLAATDIDAKLIRSARIVHVDDEDQKAALVAAKMAKDAGVISTSDIDRVNKQTLELIALVSIPIVAQHVLPEMTGEVDAERGLRAIRAAHPHKPFVVTLGASGSMMLDGDRAIHAPAVRVEAIDTTGAGDVFRAAFIYALLNDLDPPEMLRFANAAAAASCTRKGAMAGVSSLEEVKRVISGESGPH